MKKQQTWLVFVAIIVISIVALAGLNRSIPRDKAAPVGGTGNEPVTRNAGCTQGYNGSWIAHGVGGDPGITGSITLSLRGLNQYNATMILRVPTVISSNATHFQIEFYMWETVTWTLVPVTTVEQQWIYWDAYYKV